MRTHQVCIVAALVAALAGAALAQDLTPEEKRTKATELAKEAKVLSDKKAYASAVAKLQEAYSYFASPKLLYSLGQVLQQLGNSVEAANLYQRFLDDPGADSAKRTEVTKLLTTLDAKLAVLAIKVTPADAEIQLVGWQPGWLVPAAEAPWLPAAQIARVRIAPGSFVVKARKTGFKPTDVSGTASEGSNRSVELTLLEEPKVVDPIVIAPPPPPPDDPVDDDVDVHADLPVEAPAPPAMQLGAVVDVAIDASKFEGFAVSPGISVRLIGKLEAVAKAQIGGAKGLYLGATYYLLDGKLRPQIGAGVPLFFSDGVRVGVRGAVGVCYDLGARLSVVGEVGGEYFFNPEMDRLSFSLVPVVGVHARL
jgi:hypothetical protein